MMWLAWSLLLGLTLVRWLRWLAVVQQKEYRWDRLMVYLKTAEGQRDVWQVLPTPRQLTPAGLKRPVRTMRLYLTAAFSFVLSLLLWWWFGASLSVAVALYLLTPAIIALTLLPSTLVRAWWVQNLLVRARARLQATNPVIIGITGSYGKSSTKHLVAHVLSQSKPVFMTPKSHNTRHSVATAILKQYQQQPLAVLEYAAYTRGEIKALANWFHPDIAVITGLAPQHLSLFGSVEAIVDAKSELIKALKTPSQPGVVFYNAADDGTLKICTAGGAVEPVPYSGEHGVVPVQHVGLNQDGLMSLVWRGHTISTQLVGLQNLAAVQAAVAMGETFGVTEPEIVRGLESFQPTETFVQLKRSTSGFVVYDDGGTSNPTGFKALLQLVSQIKNRRRVLLITSGIIDLGSQSVGIHTELAQQAAAVADQVFYLGSAGLPEFQAQFGDRLCRSRAEWSALLTTLSSEWLVAIEGRVPRWVYHELGVSPR